MILFKPEHIKPILEGHKIRTTRFWTKRRAKPGSLHKAKTTLFSKTSFALLRIISVEQKRLMDMTIQEIQEDGFETRYEFYKKLCEINKVEITKEFSRQLVWTIKFEVEK